MPPAGFESAIPENERLQKCALDRVATGIGFNVFIKQIIRLCNALRLINIVGKGNERQRHGLLQGKILLPIY
jgi:hypothetical protein